MNINPELLEFFNTYYGIKILIGDAERRSWDDVYKRMLEDDTEKTDEGNSDDEIITLKELCAKLII